MGYQPGQPYRPITPDEGAGRKGCGCFAWGCLTVLVLLTLMVVGAFYWMRGFFYDLSTDKPASLPPVSATEQDYQAVRTKVEAFRSGVEGAAPLTPLELTADEINTFIAHDPSYKEIRDYFRVYIEGDTLGVVGSVPLETFGLSGRYLNGKASAKVSYDDRGLQIHITDLEYNGQRSEEILSQIRDTNLGDELVSRNPDMHEGLRNVSSISVQNGKLIIEGKPHSANSSGGGVGDRPAAEQAPSQQVPAAKPPTGSPQGVKKIPATREAGAGI
jgi:hypothetical protein